MAIHDEDADLNNLTSIKLNKLLYLAVDKFDLPITYSWYKYGASLSGGQNDVAVGAVEPQALADLPSPDEPSIGNSWDYPSPEEYRYFFKSDIELTNILQEETKSYLREFYTGYAPEEYRDLYVASAVLQKSLDTILDMGAEEFNENSAECLDTVEEELRDLDLQILLNSHVEDDEENALTAYTDLLRQVVINLDSQATDLSQKQFQKFRRLLKFYYSHAWKYVSLGISEKTASGPSRRDLIGGAVNDLDSLEKNYTGELQALRKSCEDAELVPTMPEQSITVDADSPIDPDAEAVDAALESIRSNMQSREYASLDPEEFTK
ncbi:hypothetical protein [Halorubrum sp. AS12]|uniref:hypothetical protein n=1 Tax=Halorubrum sp. AS12 TaxID=3409687 RepID=UPI003DA77ABB